MKEVLEVLRHMQECIHDLRRDVESLREENGIQIGNSPFDYMDEAIEKLEALENLKNNLKGEMTK